MKRISFLFILLLINSYLFAQDTLTVMTYNIYHGEKAYQPGKSNLEDIAELINQVDPDFVALQEVDSLTQRSAALNEGIPENLVKALAERTGMHGYFGRAIAYDGGGYGVGILSRKSFNARKVMLPIPKGGEKRTMLVLEAQTKTGRPFLFVGTHLCHQHLENRLAQVRRINDYFSGVKRPAIIGGDFNFPPGRKSYKEMASMWKDAAAASGTAAPTISYENPTRRIDYLFLSKGENWEVIDLDVPDVGHSDHMPVAATVVLH